MISETYLENGYVLLKGFYTESDIENIKPVILRFHNAWMQANRAFYEEKAINSAYLTGKQFLCEEDRLQLLRFIASKKLGDIITPLPFQKPAFMNTQLFFNPFNKDQKNYWHRDPQYHLSVDDQKASLAGPEVIHFRIALADELGIELIPGTHQRWDNDEELAVRLEKSGHQNHEDISTGVKIPLKRGDVLIFSAHMIHRGIYGNDRLALDLLICESHKEFLRWVEEDCLPENSLIDKLDFPYLFSNTINAQRD